MQISDGHVATCRYFNITLFYICFYWYHFYLHWNLTFPFGEKSLISIASKILSRSSLPEVFLWKGVLKICIKFTEEHPCRSATSIKLQSNFNTLTPEITLWHGCSAVNLLYIFRTPFAKNTSEGLVLTLGINISSHFKLHSPRFKDFLIWLYS